MDKKLLRAQCLKARQSLAPATTQAAAMAIISPMLSAIPSSAKSVAGYLAHRGEIDLIAALSELHACGHQLCLPVIVKENAPLVFRSWKPGDPLEKGLHGIEVPLSSAPPVIPEAIIVPLVAFDKAGHRLGYGAGYYDRTIERLKTSQKPVQIIGAAYSMQQIDSIPHEPHDQRLDAVVTEKGIVQFT